MPQKKVLILDYEIDNYLIVQGILEDKDIEIDLLIDGKQIIEKCKNNDYELIIMNNTMPDVNVMQSSLKIKEIKPNVPVILMCHFVKENMDSTLIGEIADSIVGLPLNYKKISKQLNGILKIENSKKRFGFFGV